MQDLEEILERKTTMASNPLVVQLLQQLDQAVVYSSGGNASINKKLWDNYSREWGADAEWYCLALSLYSPLDLLMHCQTKGSANGLPR